MKNVNIYDVFYSLTPLLFSFGTIVPTIWRLWWVINRKYNVHIFANWHHSKYAELVISD